MSRYPGAHWIPTGDAGAMTGLRGCTWHEAVTRGTGQDIASWVSQEHSAQMYNGEQGDFYQYMDVGRKANGVAAGNHDLLTVESYDGLKILQNPYREVGIGGVYGDDANSGRWDDGQFERAADVMAWLYLDYGVPIQMMPDSKPSSTGHAPHRLGIAPWRVAGGEVWTAHDGEPCPGDLRVGQMPAIVARAQVIAAAIKAGHCTYLPPGPVDVAAARARTTVTQPVPVPPGTTIPPHKEIDMYLAQTRDTKGREVWATVDASGVRYINDPTMLADLKKAGLPSVRVTREWYNANRASGTGQVN